MNRILMGCVAAGALSCSANAADMAVKAPPMVAPVLYNWTGWYVGGNIGGAFNNETASELAVSGAGFPILGAGTPLYGGTQNFKLNSSGFIGGAQAGYNWQTSTNTVVGVEADIQGSGLKGSTPCVVVCGTPLVTAPAPAILAAFPVIFGSNSFSHQLDWFGTVRGRVGYTTGGVLFYVTGGLAYGDVERSGSVVGRTTFLGAGTVNAFAGSYNASSTNVGGTIGAGAEAKLSTNWSVKLEYLYADLGKTTDAFSTRYTTAGGGAVLGTVAATRTDTSTNRYNIIRVGLNYKFGGPVVAKY
jgi:outer membrane immunogenic protein